MFSETLFNVALFFAGYLLVPALSQANPVSRLFLSFPIGCVLYALVSVVSLVLWNSFSPVFMVAFIIGVGVIYNLACFKREKINVTPVVPLIIGVSVFFGVSWVVLSIGVTILSYDSFVFVLNSWVLDADQSLELLKVKLLNYPIFIHFFHATASYFGFEFHRSLSPLIFINCMLAAINVSVKGGAFRSSRLFLFVSLLVVAALFSNWMTIVMLFYVNGHAIFAGYLLIAVFYLLKMKGETSSRNWWVVSLGLSALVLLRLEGPLIVALVFCIVPNLPIRVRVALTLIPIMTAIVWYGYLLVFSFEGQKAGSITDGGKIIALICLMLATPLSFLFPRLRDQPSLRQALCMLSLCVVLLVVYFTSQGNMSRSVGNMLVNAFILDFWQMTWIATAMFMMCFLVFSRVQIKSDIVFLVSAFFTSLLLLAYLRGDLTFRIGWGDSANRMAFHFLPLCAVTIILFMEEILLNRRAEG